MEKWPIYSLKITQRLNPSPQRSILSQSDHGDNNWVDLTFETNKLGQTLEDNKMTKLVVFSISFM